MNWIQQFTQRVEQENPQPERQGKSKDPQALRFVDDFLEACCEVSDGAETPADTLYANYQAFCESRHVVPVNATAFSVRVMNVYRGVQRDEVVNDGKRVTIYRGLAPKPQTETPPAEMVSEPMPTEPVPILPEREPGEDEAGISGTWPPKAWSLADWVRGAKGDFHVRATLTGDPPISRGFSWRD